MQTKKKGTVNLFKLAFVFVFIITVLVCLVVSLKYYTELNNYCKTAVVNLQNGNSNLFFKNDFVNQVNETDLPDEIKSEILNDYSETESPIVSAILSNSDVFSKKSIIDNSFTITINAPNMAEFIKTYDKDLSNEKILLDDAIDYCNTANKKEYSFTVKYRFADKERVPEYNEREFINAVTGGLAEEYSELMNRWLDEQIKVLEDK